MLNFAVQWCLGCLGVLVFKLVGVFFQQVVITDDACTKNCFIFIKADWWTGSFNFTFSWIRSGGGGFVFVDRQTALACFSCSSEGNGFIKPSFCWLGYNDCSWERKPFKSFDQLSPHTIKFSYNGIIKLIVMCLCPQWLAERRDLFLLTTGWQLSNQSTVQYTWIVLDIPSTVDSAVCMHLMWKCWLWPRLGTSTSQSWKVIWHYKCIYKANRVK